MKPADYALLAATFFSFPFSVYLRFQGMREEGLQSASGCPRFSPSAASCAPR
jgi:hypothetical protein